MRYSFLYYLLFILLSCDYNFNADDIKKKQFVSQVLFDPHKVEDLLIQLINETKESIDISLYGLENIQITDAIINAYKRNIKIRASTEIDSLKSNSWQAIINAGIPVIAGNKNGIMHNKYFIFDNRYLITGSNNITESMFDSFNNTILIQSPYLIKEYLKDFEIQLAGYYGSQKQDGYHKVINTKDNSLWETIPYQIDKFIIKPYFSPYKSIMADYQKNIGSFVSCTNSCIKSVNATNDTCINEECKDTVCYDSELKHLQFKYFNYDSIKYRCPRYNNSINPILPYLKNAKKSITILAFAFRDYLIMDILLQQAKKNIDIKVWIDSSQYILALPLTHKTYQKLVEDLKLFKICKRNDGGLLHHKVIIIDNEIVILGSLNFSSNAVQNNDENYLLIQNAQSIANSFLNEINSINAESYIPTPTIEYQNRKK